jgi:hypothetical protein
VELWDYELTQGKGGRYLFRQCEAEDLTHVQYPRLGVSVQRCGANAMRGVSFERHGERHSLLVCDRHTLKYVGF